MQLREDIGKTKFLNFCSLKIHLLLLIQNLGPNDKQNKTELFNEEENIKVTQEQILFNYNKVPSVHNLNSTYLT
jgi:hypothetical protein